MRTTTKKMKCQYLICMIKIMKEICMNKIWETLAEDTMMMMMMMMMITKMKFSLDKEDKYRIMITV